MSRVKPTKDWLAAAVDAAGEAKEFRDAEIEEMAPEARRSFMERFAARVGEEAVRLAPRFGKDPELLSAKDIAENIMENYDREEAKL